MLAQLPRHSYSRKMPLLRRNAGFSFARRLLLGPADDFRAQLPMLNATGPIFPQFTA
jgi:hypothetical protein